MKILILGSGRHGKDTAAEILAEMTGMTFSSSSTACVDIFIFDSLKNVLGYKTVDECYNSRHNHRELWYQLICAYNKHDKARLASEILERNDIYIGMRDAEEYEASKHLFDHILWVDASERVKTVDPTMKIYFNHEEMLYVNNNYDKDHFRLQLTSFVEHML